jgi:hypothetical protein
VDSLDGQVLTLDDALHVHEAGAIGTRNILCTRLPMMADLVLTHADRDSLLLDSKHATESAALVWELRLEDLDALYEIEQVAQLIIIRCIQLAGT